MIVSAADAETFIRANTVLASPPLVPELSLYLATEITPIWKATEVILAEAGIDPPFWAFAWAGGQALARYVLDHPGSVGGRRTLDVGAGSGMVAIAASRAGASESRAVDIDTIACRAIELNAGINHVGIGISPDNPIGLASGAEIILVGDLCYERAIAEPLLRWLRQEAGRGVTVLMGDPGRTYRPTDGLEELARYKVATSLELEDRIERDALVWRVLA
jgi:predicted nicotinamide N-methyase